MPWDEFDNPELLDWVRDAIRVCHYSLRTEEAYVHWIRTFILFHRKRHPEEMGEAEVSRFLTHLAVNQKVMASTLNQWQNPPEHSSLLITPRWQ